MRVRDLMSRNVTTIEESETLHDAVERMVRAKVRHLPVLDRKGALIGIVTDRDIRHRLFAPDVYGRVGQVPLPALLREAHVRAVMSAPVRCIGPDSDVAAAAERMRKDRVGSLAVVEAQRLVGIVTEIDVLRHICGSEGRGEPGLDIVVSYP
jgi:acetoin utilization protein AcuB